MDKLLIRGGRQLHGEVRISGAKNAALPELCAALLTAEPVTLANVPRLQDVSTMLKLIRNMGVAAERADDGTVTLNAGSLSSPEAPYELVKTMRASVLALGPLLARFGEATVSLPGGCAIGSRPVDQHIKGLQAMGADITVDHGYIVARAARLKGARITTDMVTVTGTENLLMAATLADGETVLENAAQEPEIPDLAELLIVMGARIEGLGTSQLVELTTTQVADQLGLTESTIRDWPRRYGIATHQGRYRWGDIKTVIRSRNRARMKTPLRLHQDVLGNPAVSCDTGGVGRAMPKTEER